MSRSNKKPLGFQVKALPLQSQTCALSNLSTTPSVQRCKMTATSFSLRLYYANYVKFIFTHYYDLESMKVFAYWENRYLFVLINLCFVVKHSNCTTFSSMGSFFIFVASQIHQLNKHFFMWLSFILAKTFDIIFEHFVTFVGTCHITLTELILTPFP